MTGVQTCALPISILQVEQVNYRVEDGECVIADLEWVLMRHAVMPVRRALTHAEAEAVRALFKADGGDLTTADFPKVKTYGQFAMIAESAWLDELLEEERYTSVLQKIVHASQPSKVFAREALLRGIARDDSIIHPTYLFDAAREIGRAHV